MKLTSALLLLAATPIWGANVVASNGTWSDPSIWTDLGDNSNHLPGNVTDQSDNAIINNGRTVTLSSDQTTLNGTLSTVTVGNQTSASIATSNLIMTSTAALSINNFYMGGNGAAGYLTYEDGASMVVSGQFLMNDNTDDEGNGSSSSTLKIVLGATGLESAIAVTTLNLRQNLNDAILEIDASALINDQQRTIDLMTISNSGFGQFNQVNITGIDDAGYSADVFYTSNSLQLRVVPEPSSTLLTILGGFAILARRERS